tara:strand:- start:619 stop:852 length:234 start_codon:yes stop_codon:yes gene_type:complete
MKNFTLIRISKKHLMVTFSGNVGRFSQHFSMLLSKDGFAEFEKLELIAGNAIPKEWVDDCSAIVEDHHGQSSYNKRK